MPFVRRGSGYRRGMGLYPTSPCFDPTRPGWLPYWIDTPSESGCKFQFYPSVTTLATPPTPPALAAPAAPQTLEQMTVPGAYSPTQSAIDTSAASQAAAQNFLNTVVTAPACDWTQANWLDFSTWCGMNWLFAGGTALAALLFLRGGR